MKKKLIVFIMFLFAFISPSFNLKASESNIANLVVFSYDGKSSSSSGSSFNFSGHSFLMVENISSSKIIVGKMSLDKNEIVTIGTWGNKNQHKGVWYNL